MEAFDDECKLLWRVFMAGTCRCRLRRRCLQGMRPSVRSSMSESALCPRDVSLPEIPYLILGRSLSQEGEPSVSTGGRVHLEVSSNHRRLNRSPG